MTIMKVFCHNLYQYQKGLRVLALNTMNIRYMEEVTRKLRNAEIDFLIHRITDEKMNVFFGHPLCVDIVRKFNKTRLSDLTDEEDYILGVMLGHGILNQCERYLSRCGAVEPCPVTHGESPISQMVPHGTGPLLDQA